MNKDPQPSGTILNARRKAAKQLTRQQRNKNEQACYRIKYNHPRYAQTGFEEIARDKAFGLRDAQQVIARENGYRDWKSMLYYLSESALSTSESKRNHDFESAAESICNGRLDTLSELLIKRPSLVYERSRRDHCCTLLHYITANGIEENRQRTPANIREITALLLETGADPNAIANTYDGGLDQTPLNLLVSSIHPCQAGTQADLAEMLVEAGAELVSTNPLLTAIQFFHTEAAQRLHKLGAPTGNLCISAALGLQEEVANYFDAKGNLMPDGLKLGRATPIVTPNSQDAIDLAFNYALCHERMDTANFLLAKGAGINRQMAGLQSVCNPLHRAAGQGRKEVVRYLLKLGARSDILDPSFSGTALDWARHAGHEDCATELSRKAENIEE